MSTHDPADDARDTQHLPRTPHEETTMDPDRTQPLATDLGLDPVPSHGGTAGDPPVVVLEKRGPAETAQPVPAPAPAAPVLAGATATSVTSGRPDDRPDGVRVGTVVWGLVLAAVGVGLIAVASGVTFDVELAVIVLIAAAGAALLVGSLATAARRRGTAAR